MSGPPDAEAGEGSGGVALLWLPLGAGGHSVKWNGRVYELALAALERRSRRALYHSALVVDLPGARHVIEVTPVRVADGPERGVVAEGAVGMRAAGRLRAFRYEVRCWRDGVIPDAAEAVGGPRSLGADGARARRLLELAPSVPTPTWGRDELRAGEMWNSNSVVAWLLARGGFRPERLRPPAGGRAPGWHAGVVVARRGDPAAR